MTLRIEQVVLLKLLNGLEASFLTYLTILNEQARRYKSFPKLDELLKNHEDGESRVKQDSVAIANVISKAKQSISSSDYQKPKRKNSVRIAKKIIEENADSLRPDVISVTRLSISHLLVRVHPRKKRTSRKKE